MKYFHEKDVYGCDITISGKRVYDTLKHKQRPRYKNVP